MKKLFLTALAVSGMMFSFGTAQAADQKFVTIGTGGVTGVYYRVGGALCRLVNKGAGEHGIRCSVESTGGSVFNINAIRNGELDLGVAQSDWQYHAYNGTSKFKDQGAFDKLRAVFSVHSEAFTVVSREDAKIKKFDDVKGTRFNVGVPGSGQRATFETVMKVKGWTLKDFKLASELKPAEMSSALCDNQIDGYVYVVGHPSGSLQEASATCSSKLVSVTGDEIKKLVKETPYYAAATIPGGTYKGNPDDVQTFGVKGTLVASADTDADLIYQIVKAAFENFDDFRKFHPAFAHLKKEDMVQAGLSAPLHEGAVRYYKEAGLLK